MIMRQMKGLTWYCILALVTLLTACGGSSSDNPSPQLSATEGVAVDPYIVGAVFLEMTADGRTLQLSSASDSQGRFSFPEKVQAGSIIEMKNDSRGYHAGVPFPGLVRRQVAAGTMGPLVVSPLTTLLANGATATEVISFLQEAGIPGLTVLDLLSDPMAGLQDLGSGQVSEELLRNLHAAMAVNTLMHLLNDYTIGGATLATPTNRQLMTNLVSASRQLLSPERFEAMADGVAADSEFAGHPLHLGEMIEFAAQTMQNIGELAGGGSLPSQSAISQ
ncbi:MAG: hypothetical protein IH614_10745, partial [Desulfuromonadales bacterium]|nr:hypothetical protein [Desulfuromonadales bacterium]